MIRGEEVEIVSRRKTERGNGMDCMCVCVCEFSFFASLSFFFLLIKVWETKETNKQHKTVHELGEWVGGLLESGEKQKENGKIRGKYNTVLK